MYRNRVRPFLVVSYETILRVLFALPRYRLLNKVKSAYLRINGARIGARVTYYPGVWIAPGRNLTVGDDVDFALDVVVTTAGGVTIGDRTLIGYRAQILSTNHAVPDGHRRIFGAGHVARPVVIGSDVWIGAGAIVLPGIRVGEGAVIAAGSVVTKPVEPFTVVAGVPARVIRRRN